MNEGRGWDGTPLEYRCWWFRRWQKLLMRFPWYQEEVEMSSWRGMRKQRRVLENRDQTDWPEQ